MANCAHEEKLDEAPNTKAVQANMLMMNLANWMFHEVNTSVKAILPIKNRLHGKEIQST